MIVIALMVVAIVSVPLCGGRLAAIGRVEVEETWLIILGFVVQTAVISMAPQGLEPIAHAVHLASYLLAAAFLVINLHVPWLWLIGLGGAMNFVAILANGGTMPAGAWATRVAGMVIADGEFANSEMVADPKLLFLGDVFPIPASWPLSNVFSVGDVLLVLGAFALLHSVSGSRLSGARRASRRAADAARTERHVGFVTRNELVDAS